MLPEDIYYNVSEPTPHYIYSFSKRRLALFLLYGLVPEHTEVDTFYEPVILKLMSNSKEVLQSKCFAQLETDTPVGYRTYSEVYPTNVEKFIESCNRKESKL